MSFSNGFLLFLILMNILIMVFFWIFIKTHYSSKKILLEIRHEIDTLITDLGRETDRDVAILERRIKDLRELMDIADKRIVLAKNEIEKREIAAELIENLHSDSAVISPIKIYTKQNIVRSENQIEAIIPVSERVIQLFKEGFSAEFIASKLSIPVGEVELILDMNNSSL